jgi:hypothetical protein
VFRECLQEKVVLLRDSGRSAPAEDRKLLPVHEGCLPAGTEVLVTGAECYFHLVGQICDLKDTHSFWKGLRTTDEDNF